MSRTESYKDHMFTVEDADARIRSAANLMQFEKFVAGDLLPPGEQIGNFKRIPQGTQVKVDDVKLVQTGGKGSMIFARALSADGVKTFGWTSTANFRGKFINETLGAVEPKPGTDRFGPNAAWEAGQFLRQVTVVNIVDVTVEVERIALDMLDAYLGLVSAAAENNVRLAIHSGFRSFPEQALLFDGFKKGLPGFNLAAEPGKSKHQNGIAFDIDVPGGLGNPTYDWLTQNAPARGFIRTVNDEPWHWEFDRNKAAIAVAAHTFKTSNVSV